jgi:predicted esterase
MVRRWVFTALLGAAASGLAANIPSFADVITLKNGMQLEGGITKLSSLYENPMVKQSTSGAVSVKKIVLVDDGLRRTFVSSNQVRAGGVAPGRDVILTEIPIKKPVANTGRTLGAVGPILEVTPFDEFGNRVFSMQAPKGRLDVVQGITEITPIYTKLEGLQSKGGVAWDMRVATASIPLDVLLRVLHKNIDNSNAQDRLKVVTLFLQAERYLDALRELDQIIVDFPELREAQDQRQRLLQLVATSAIREIEFRSKAGQHRQALTLLQNFPEKDVAGELLIKVRDLFAKYEEQAEQIQQVSSLLDQHLQLLTEDDAFGRLSKIVDEIKQSLSFNNLDRMADYLRLASDKTLKADQKLALAISGWVLGSGEGLDNLVVATDLVQIRETVRAYLRSDDPLEREDLLRELRELEGSSPSNLAKIIRQMNPPRDTDFGTADPSGVLELTFPGLTESSDFRYLVQLPPEYDPMRRYPCVITLHGSSTTPSNQVNWWAGAYDATKKIRIGQATRRGYIVIAPAWAEPHQTEYEYSLRAHAAVLGALRDACRRFSIDTDRVFLSGHSMGGDAAWDIGLAHPDLWAGVLPVVATADKYVSRYWENGRGLPMYFVAGELDGNRITKNARDLDRYFRYAGFDAIYVEYQGRGHEHFHDEILRMFDWMDGYRRDFFKKEFECITMRPWDQFFWWLELDDFPSRSLVLPVHWPPGRVSVARTEAIARNNNTIRVKTAAADVTVWLAPQIVDFDREVSVNGDDQMVQPDNAVLLEDVRTRGDRQNPFWAKITPQVGRRK